MWQPYADSKDVSILKTIFNENLWILETKNARETFLRRAICDHDAEAVKTLIELGEDPNKPDSGGFPHIIMAVAESSESDPEITISIIKSLASAGADLNCIGSGGYMPLHWAAHNNQSWLITELVGLGADIDGRMSVDGELTPLMVAAQMGSRDAADTLIQLGADRGLKSHASLVDEGGLTAAQMASKPRN